MDVAIVTGGTGAIGRETCKLLAADGWRVIAADITPPETALDPVEFVQTDVSSVESVEALVRHATKRGTIGAAVIGHGMLRKTPTGTLDESVVDNVIDVNLKGAIRVFNRCLPHIRKDGSFVFLSSVSVRMGRAQDAYAYQSAKAALEAITRTFSISVAERGLRVNCIEPGFMSAPMRGEGTTMRQHQGGNDAVQERTPMKRLIDPAEVASVIAFLCSSKASGVTGIVLPVDGGQTAF